MGLAMRAGQITLGANLGINVIRSGKAALVLIDEDASENTRKKLTDACVYRHVPFLRCLTGALMMPAVRTADMPPCSSRADLPKRFGSYSYPRENPI